MLTVSAASVKRSSLSSRSGARSGSSRSVHTQFKMDESYDPEVSNQHTPIVTSTKATKCIRPKDWSPQVEEGTRASAQVCVRVRGADSPWMSRWPLLQPFACSKPAGET